MVQRCEQALSQDRFRISLCRANTEFLDYLQSKREGIDCLMLEGKPWLDELARHLCEHGLVLPAIVILEDKDRSQDADSFQYHSAEVQIGDSDLEHLSEKVDLAIAQFLRLAPLQCVATIATPTQQPSPSRGDGIAATDPILLQQQRLTERLKERLGYLGVYYKRDPQRFLRNLAPPEAKHLIGLLETTYRDIVLNYFSRAGDPNSSIEHFVDMAFFADIPVTKIVEIHMNLMDEFSKQLKLEGRSEAILLDYRLTLIDVIAHLCEMYRRSIPRNS
jgi:circadian clock protein KaiA